MKKAIIWTLSIINLIASLVLGFLYYLGFVFHWAISKDAVTWGLLFPIGIIISLFLSVTAIKKKRWKPGFAGFLAVSLVLGYFVVLTTFFDASRLPMPEGNSKHGPVSTEEKIIALVLSDGLSGTGYYTVVHPETSVHANKEYVNQAFSSKDYDLSKLIDRLYEANPEVLNLESSPRDGYYIDYQGEFSRYFLGGGYYFGDGELFHPRASGYTEISIPAYDPSSSYVLIYVGVSYGPLFGVGKVILFSYENGRLIYIDSVETWIS